ncbi:hypothetical protein [Azospirillum argentinense]
MRSRRFFCRHIRIDIMCAQRHPHPMNFGKTDKGTWAIVP